MKLEALKLEIRKIVQERSINAIAKLQQKNIEDISKALEFYKKNKHTDKKEAFIKVLKKLGDDKAKLAGELDLKVSGMYKDAEYKGEGVVKESVNESINELGISKMFMVYLGVQNKVRNQEKELKDLLGKWKSEKDVKKKVSIQNTMKKKTTTLKKTRANLSDIETNYINNVDYDTPVNDRVRFGESVNEGKFKKDVLVLETELKYHKEK